MGITSLVLEKFGLITGAGLDGTLLTMLARDGEVFFVLLRASSLVLPEERPGKSSAPPFDSKDLAVGGGVNKKSMSANC